MVTPAGEAIESRLSPRLSLTAFLVLCVGVPLYLIRETPAPSDSTWMLAYAVSLGSGLRYAALIGRGQSRLYELMTWLFVYAFLGLAPLVQLRTGVPPATTPYVDTSLNGPAMWIVIVGCVAMAIGMQFSPLRRIRSRGETEDKSISASRTLVLGVVGLLAAGYYASRVGLGPLLSSRAERSSVAQSVWSDPTTAVLMYSTVSMTLLVATVSGLMQIARRRHLGGDTRWTAQHVLTLVTGVSLLVLVNPISSPRYAVGTMYLALAAALGAFSTPRRFRISAAAAVGGLLLIFPIADAFRYSADPTVKTTGLVDSLGSPDFDVVRQINNTLLYVNHYGVTHGRQALGVLLFWVPRSSWPNKPLDTGIFLANFMHYRVTNLSAPLWTEMYINGGWLLLIIGMACFGWSVRAWDSSSAQRHGALGPSAYILPFYLLFILRGSLLQAMANLVIVIVASRYVTRLPVKDDTAGGSSITSTTKRKSSPSGVSPGGPISDR